MRKNWKVANRASDEHFNKFPDSPKLITQILYNRGLIENEDIENFLSYNYPNDNPFLLKDMTIAVERLHQAIIQQEQVVVYGDYDADGVTATALMMQLLTAVGAKVEAYIPNRFSEGYGLNNNALDNLAEKGTNLIVTVDCGIRSIEEVAYSNSLGMDVIITDHHSVGQEIPAALAIINPKQSDCPYPFKELAGVGLAYKLAQALLQTNPPNSNDHNPCCLDDFLDLVALGSVADLVPLYGENRILVNKGVERLNLSLRPGLEALMNKIGVNDKSISAKTIGFTIGPRLNAAGRLDNAMAAYHLLTANDNEEAIKLAEKLELLNCERQNLTWEAVETARQIILDSTTQQPLYFISSPDFNPGIVGLVASRLTDEFYRPAIVAEQGAEQTVGSARSIKEFHITDALEQCADLLVRYGGHAAAAGFTVKNENLPALKKRLVEIAAKTLDVTQLHPTISIDGEVNLKAVKPSLIEDIIKLQPFGRGNPIPSFLTRNLQIRYLKAVGREQKHLRLTLFDGRQIWYGIAFRQGELIDRLHLHTNQFVDVVYNLEFNEWQGERNKQLNIKDLRPSSK